MGGHGGLNILPQKRWNVYNYENREKVRRDEEAAAKEEQLKREQARKRDAEFRLEQLRAARGLAPVKRTNDAIPSGSDSKQKSGSHINLFEGIKIFDPLEEEGGDEKNGSKKKKMMRKEEATTKVVTAEDEKYRLGYGVAGKGVKLPWYLERRSGDANVNANAGGEDSNGGSLRVAKEEGKKSGKKAVEELREERLKRERREKERERALLRETSRRDGGFSKESKHARRV